MKLLEIDWWLHFSWCTCMWFSPQPFLISESKFYRTSLKYVLKQGRTSCVSNKDGLTILSDEALLQFASDILFQGRPRYFGVNGKCESQWIMGILAWLLTVLYNVRVFFFFFLEYLHRTSLNLHKKKWQGSYRYGVYRSRGYMVQGSLLPVTKWWLRCPMCLGIQCHLNVPYLINDFFKKSSLFVNCKCYYYLLESSTTDFFFILGNRSLFLQVSTRWSSCISHPPPTVYLKVFLCEK